MRASWGFRKAAAAVFVLLALPGWAQGARSVAAAGALRDVAIDAVRGTIFVARYDDGSVLRFDAALLTFIDAIPAGRGASALAVSADGAVLACVNRLDETVTLISLESGAVIATTPVGRMPSDVAALPGGGFAVVNAFSDSISLVDDRSGALQGELTGVASAPSAIAASGGVLAVAVRAPRAVLLYAGGERSPVATVELDAAATALAALPGGRFCAATATEVILFDGGSGRVLQRAAVGAQALAADADFIYAADAGSLVVFDGALREISRTPLNGPTGLAAGGGLRAAVAPGSVNVEGTFAPTMLAAAPEVPEAVSSETFVEAPESFAPEEALEPEPPASVDEVEELPAPEAAAVEDEAADLAEEPAARVDEPEAVEGARAPEPEAEAAPATAEETPVLAEAAETATQRRPTYYPLRLSFLSQRVHAPELGLGADLVFREQLQRSLEREGEHAGLLGLNWQRNPEPERFDSWIRRGATDTFEGDVEFNVDDAVVNTEKMVRDDDTGEIAMEGGVSVAREDDSFRAAQLRIRAPEEMSERAQLAGIPIVPRGYKPPRRLTYAGYVEASDVEWSEEYRDLTAERLETTLDEENLEASRVHGRAGDLFFDADRLTLSGPDSLMAEHAWVSTCDHDPPHYTLNFKNATLEDGVLTLRNARLRLYGVSTPIVVPRLRYDTREDQRRYRVDFEFGATTELGTYANLGQWYSVSPYLDLGIRTMPTTRDGFGYGIDAVYDFREDPRSPLFRSTGSLQSLFTTEERGYVDFRHQQDLTLKTRFVGQVQQWSDEDFLRDWFNDQYEDQNGPRTFANLTHTRPGQILTLTASPSTHGFQRYSEKLPEATYHLLDRQIAKNLYLSWDSYAGYYEFEPAAITTGRAVNIARMTYDIELGNALNVLPFVEADYSLYTDRMTDEHTEERFGVTGGVTAQSRLTRSFGGIGPYAKLKHVMVPSVSYLHRPNPTGQLNRTPQLDGLDFRPGRSRVEGKIDNVLLAEHAETGDIWQLAHLAIYAGSDFESEIGTSDDIEVDFSFRPVQKWGMFTSAEYHNAEAEAGIPGGNFSRILSYVFYDNSFASNTFTARLGYSYSDLDEPLQQNEVLYGAGVRLGKKWSVGFEHRLELDNNEVTRQTYELRRLMHDWELAMRVRDREDATDISVSFTLIDFPSASLKF